jgi:hypothetical protein
MVHLEPVSVRGYGMSEICTSFIPSFGKESNESLCVQKNLNNLFINVIHNNTGVYILERLHL